ncbi:MAG: HNH endonuclease [Nanoarchaeota archaeon]
MKICKNCKQEIKNRNQIYCSNNCKNKFRKGKKMYEFFSNFDETRKKMSLAKKNKTHVEIFGEKEALRRKLKVKKIGYQNRGRKRKDMVEKWKKIKQNSDELLKKSIRNIRKRPSYQKWRLKILERYNYTCCICNSIKNLEVDHIKPILEYPELMFDENNGQVLCRKCHLKKCSKELSRLMKNATKKR